MRQARQRREELKQRSRASALGGCEASPLLAPVPAQVAAPGAAASIVARDLQAGVDAGLVAGLVVVVVARVDAVVCGGHQCMWRACV